MSNTKTIKRVYVDPPFGWMYGFPMAVPDEYVKDGVIVDEEGYKSWFNTKYTGECSYITMRVVEEEIEGE